MTKDERFLVALYNKVGDKTYDPQRLAIELRYSERLLKNVLKGLMQANLVKRYSSDEIGLTERGLVVVKSLML